MMVCSHSFWLKRAYVLPPNKRLYTLIADNEVSDVHKTRIEHLIQTTWPSASIESMQVVQGLWSDYGAIVRIGLSASDKHPASVVAKVVVPPTDASHPRGWNTDASHQRKLKSYQVETRFYEHYAAQCKEDCAVALCYATEANDDGITLLLEDLDTNFPARRSTLTVAQAEICLNWLAAFHALFMGSRDDAVWPTGTYWHLDTRPDELAAMEAGELKQAANQLDKALNNTEFRTLLHGDAKVANFCFSKDGESVSAVDFQYTGHGCGMRDVAYFLGSCLDEKSLQAHEDELLDMYFNALGKRFPAMRAALEKEWRPMYAVAGADFHRFLSGWSPEHAKLTNYSGELVKQALHYLETHS